MSNEYINMCIDAITLLRRKKHCSLTFEDLQYTNKTKFPNSICYFSCICHYNNKRIEMLIPENYFYTPQMGIDTTAHIRDVTPLKTRYTLRVAYEILQMLKDKEYHQLHFTF